MKKPSDQLQSSYNEQYKNENSKWRFLGGKQKSSNIINLCKNFKNKKTIDIGSGDGAVIEWLDKYKFTNDLTCLEISDTGIELIKSKNLNSIVELKKFDGYSTSYKDKIFNLSLCSHVIEHVEHPRILLREIKRISEFQYFEIPIDFSLFVDLKVDHYLKYGHINIYTPSLFKFLLKSEGFEIIEEEFLFTSNELINFQFKNNQRRKIIQKIKNFIISVTPLKKIKPNAYCVLCKDSGNGISIF